MKTLHTTVAAATVLALGVAPAAAAAATPPSQLQQDLDAVVAAGATSATAQVQDGRDRESASSGAAELGSPRPAPVHGRFRAGSVTKSFIGTVILQLVAEHRLGLDDTVDQALPGVIPPGSGITVRDLLDHRSGLRDVLTTFPRPGTPEFLDLRWKSWTPRELIARVADQPVLFPPGSQASYSNTNYMLLALIIERITGKPYSAAVQQRIIRPLRLQHTYFPGHDPVLRGPHAHAYMAVQEDDGTTPLVDVTTFDPTIMWGGGEIISTTADLNRFFDALLDGRLLPPDLMKQMYVTGEDSIYGLGIIKRPLTCNVPPAWGKDGDAPGFSTWSFRSADGRRQVTLSITWGAGDSDQAVDKLLNDALCP
ncbi:MAG TPA: serine hydrolase domain-containing protein [Mycobacteriales bacterium]|nr:serine hydrolase domain-containing protein [Mycobacteriales bacterium]